MDKEEVKNLLTSDYKNRVKLSLEMINGVNFNDFRSRNQNLQLIPFKNGVLDLTKNELLPHNAKYYFTHGLNIGFDPLAKLSPDMVKFLTSRGGRAAPHPVFFLVDAPPLGWGGHLKKSGERAPPRGFF